MIESSTHDVPRITRTGSKPHAKSLKVSRQSRFRRECAHKGTQGHPSATFQEGKRTQRDTRSPVSHFSGGKARTKGHKVTRQSLFRRESAVGCHADPPTPTRRAFRHTPMPRKAHQPTPHPHKTPPTALSLRSVSRSPYLRPHTQAQKKTAPLPMLSYSLKYSIKLECYCCTCCYYSISKFLSPVTTQSPSVTPQPPLSHHSVTTQEGKRGGVPCRPANTNHTRFPAHNSVPQSAPTNPTPTQNPSHRAFPLGGLPPQRTKNLLRLGSAVHEIACFHGRQLIFTHPVHVFGPFHGWGPV